MENIERDFIRNFNSDQIIEKSPILLSIKTSLSYEDAKITSLYKLWKKFDEF